MVLLEIQASPFLRVALFQMGPRWQLEIAPAIVHIFQAAEGRNRSRKDKISHTCPFGLIS